MKRPYSKNDLLQVRIDSKIIQYIEDSISLKIKSDLDTTKSDYVRSLIMHDYLIHKKSPYYSKNTNIILFVNKTGDFIFFKSENLHFNKLIESLPFRIEMKKEKFDYYLTKEKNVKDRWIVNEFSLSRMENGIKKLIKKSSDLNGINLKQDSINIRKNIVKGSSFIRDTFVIMDDYVQYYEDNGENIESYDSLRCFVDIPTENMDIIVIVDHELYQKTTIYGDDFSPELSFDLRNGEDVIMEDNFNEIDPPLQPFRIANSFPRKKNIKGDEKYNETIEKIKKSIETLNEKINSTNEFLNYNSILLPDKYSFYNLIVPNVHIGLTWSINWPKPQKY